MKQESKTPGGIHQFQHFENAQVRAPKRENMENDKTHIAGPFKNQYKLVFGSRSVGPRHNN